MMIYVHCMKNILCLITSIDFFYLFNNYMRPLFLGQQELPNLDYYFQDGGKNGRKNKVFEN